MSYHRAYPHDPIEEIGPDVFMVRGQMQMNAMTRISRNMAIVKNGDDLSLINPIRLTPKGEAQLKALGTPKRIIRLGPFHGIDDPYYVDNFGVELWAQAGGKAYPEPPIDVELTAETPLPFPDAELFVFNGTVQPESALLIRRAGGILLTCDAIQAYLDYSRNNWFAKIMMPRIGFPKRTLVGPFWLKMMTPEDGSLKCDFDRLAALDFDHLLSAHGTLVPTGAKEQVRRAIDLAYADADGKPA